MLFAAGFLLAGLLTLLFLPALWRRALRLSRRRLEMQMPLSMDEIVAERDQLRAEFAGERRRIEQANEALQQARASDMAELGRRAGVIARLDGERASLHAQLDAAASAAEAARLEFELVNETRRLEIIALESSLESLRLLNFDLESELAQARSSLERANSASEALERERGFALTDLAAASARRDALQGAVEEAHEKLERQEAELRDLRRDKTRLTREIADALHALELARAAETELTSQAQKQNAHAREEARLQSDKNQTLRVERDALAGALEAARREAASLRAEAAPARPGSNSAALSQASDEGDELLRKAIVEIGAEMLAAASPASRANLKGEANLSQARPRKNGTRETGSGKGQEYKGQEHKGQEHKSQQGKGKADKGKVPAGEAPAVKASAAALPIPPRAAAGE